MKVTAVPVQLQLLLSLRSDSYSGPCARHEDMRRTGSAAPPILHLGTARNRAANCTPDRITSGETMSPRIRLDTLDKRVHLFPVSAIRLGILDFTAH